MEHQKRGLKKFLETRGITALLFDPGTGKTATTLDYLSILALKSPSREARILVICPLAAMDTWVIQAEEYVSPQVNYWAETLGGSLLERGEALASRGGQPLKIPEKGAARAVGVRRSGTWGYRSERKVQIQQGPDALGDEKPRLVITVINFDTLSSRRQVKSKTMADYILEGVKRYAPDMVVVDESHKIKSPSANVSRLMARIGAVAPRRAILTGTVMPHSPLDVFGQWRFLQPYAFGSTQADGSRAKATFGEFKMRYGVLGGYMGREVIGFQNLDEMNRIMAENAEVALKEDVLDLPPTRDVIIPVRLTPTEKKAYADMKTDLEVQLRKGLLSSTTNRLSQILRLRQITSGHLPDDSGGVNDIGSSKAKTIVSLIENDLRGEDRIVVFCMFSHEIEQICSLLENNKDLELMRIEGATPGEKRIEQRKRFGSKEEGRMVLVAQIKTLSLAVNELVTANHAIFGSLSYQRDDLVQARDRLNRLGQEKPVTFWYMLAPGTVDEVIYKSHVERTNLERKLLDHIQGGAIGDVRPGDWEDTEESD